MYTLKPLSPDGVPAALEKADHYRLLNEPWEAESICRDVLAVEPGNQRALLTLLLALTDQFTREMGTNVAAAREALAGVADPYRKAYYAGIIAERRAKTHLTRGGPGAGAAAYQLFREAMQHYEEAERLSPPDNDDAILRWNACARILMRDAHRLEPAPEHVEVQLE